MTVEELVAFVDQGDAEGLLAQLAAIPVAERRPLAKPAQAAWERYGTTRVIATASGGAQVVRGGTDQQQTAAQFLALASCTPAELRKLRGVFWNRDKLVETLRVLHPSWMKHAADVLLEESAGFWQQARQLVREGLSDLPTHENYVLGLYSHWGDWTRGFPLAEALANDPSFLERDIWRIFEVEGGGELSLANHDKFSKNPEHSWPAALRTLSERGLLARDRLLDASLSSLERGFSAYRAGWFSRFHEYLEPTPAERSVRRAVYLRLLGSPIPATVSFALGALLAIDADQPFQAKDLVPHLAPALTARQKGTAKVALKLLASVARREPSASPLVARAVVAGIRHETPEIQGGALDLIEMYGDSADEELKTLLLEAAPLASPSVSKRLARRGGTTTAVEPAATPALKQEPRSRLDPSRALAPLDSFDALLTLLAHVLEDDGDPNELEIALDGVARLCTDKPTDFERRVGPLRKRARAVWEKPANQGRLAASMAQLSLALAGEDVGTLQSPYGPGMADLFAFRAGRVAKSAFAGQRLTLLSTPTHRGGWLDPAVLVERMRRLDPGGVDSLDLSIALLRLAPENREGARSAATSITGESGQALRYALGATEPIGASAPLWVAAARAREPRALDEAVEMRHPDLGPDAALPAQWAPRVGPLSYSPKHKGLFLPMTPAAPEKARLDLPSTLMHRAHGDKAALRWACTMWPAGSASFCAKGAEVISGDLDWWEANWDHAAYLAGC